jgi:predicted nuclease with TOPRIM domain
MNAEQWAEKVEELKGKLWELDLLVEEIGDLVEELEAEGEGSRERIAEALDQGELALLIGAFKLLATQA